MADDLCDDLYDDDWFNLRKVFKKLKQDLDKLWWIFASYEYYPAGWALGDMGLRATVLQLY